MLGSAISMHAARPDRGRGVADVIVRVQALVKVQADWDFEDVVEHLTHSLQHQAKPIRHAALGNLHRKLAANPEDTKQVLLSVEQSSIPPCRCAGIARNLALPCVL